MGKVLVFLADGFEEIEALTPVDLLRRAKADVQTVSIGETRTVTGRSGIRVEADVLFGEAETEDADMLVLPGGMPGTTNLGAHGGLGKLLTDFAARGKFVSAICAAPTVLAKYGILRGKKAVCYPGNEPKLEAGGASVAAGAEAVRDGNVITGRSMGTAIPFGLALVEALMGTEAAEAVRGGIVYRA